MSLCSCHYIATHQKKLNVVLYSTEYKQMWTANIEKQLVICYYSVRFMFIFNLCLFCFYIVLYCEITIITDKNTVHRIFICCKSKRQMLNKLDSKRSNSKMKKKKVMKSIWLIISIRINNQVAIRTNQKNNCKQAHKNIVCMRVKKQSGQHTDTHTHPPHTGQQSGLGFYAKRQL